MVEQYYPKERITIIMAALAIFTALSMYTFDSVNQLFYEAFSGKLTKQERDDLHAAGDILGKMKQMCEEKADFKISDYYLIEDEVICAGYNGERTMVGSMTGASQLGNERFYRMHDYYPQEG